MLVLIFHVLISIVEAKRYSNDELTVVSGVPATIDEFPHSVYLAIDCGNQWVCGAAVLNQDILITAAHCVFNCDTQNINHVVEAYFGNEYLLKVRLSREIIKIKYHENYDQKTSANDIALGALDQSLLLQNNIKRIILSPTFPEVDKGIVAAWGIGNDTTEDAKLRLKSIQQNIRSKEVCSQIGKLHDGMFCAGNIKKGADHPADSDSGSALISRDYTILGLVSFRSKKLPLLMVYTNVTYYYNWVTKHAGLLYCQAQFKKYYNMKNNALKSGVYKGVRMQHGDRT